MEEYITIGVSHDGAEYIYKWPATEPINIGDTVSVDEFKTGGSETGEVVSIDTKDDLIGHGTWAHKA